MQPEPALFASPPRRRQLVSLTPLIDVVFILLIFFMLATSFMDERQLPLDSAGRGAASGAVTQLWLRPGDVRVEGVDMPLAAAAAMLAARQPRPSLVLEPAAGVSVQRLADAMAALRAQGFAEVALAGGESP